MTLVELLVTLALSALVIAAVIVTLVGGFRVWERIQGEGRQRQWLQIAFDQVRRDLVNVRRFQPVEFDGTYDMVSFPAIVSADAADGERLEELGVVSYFLDQTHHQLCRSQTPYRRLRRARLRSGCVPVLQEVNRLRWSYYGPELHGTTSQWVEHWSAPEPPLAVKMQIGYDDATTKRSATETLVIALPLVNARSTATP